MHQLQKNVIRYRDNSRKGSYLNEIAPMVSYLMILNSFVRICTSPRVSSRDIVWQKKMYMNNFSPDMEKFKNLDLNYRSFPIGMRAFQSWRDQHDGPVRRTVYKIRKYLHNTSRARSYWTWGLLASGLRGCEGRQEFLRYPIIQSHSLVCLGGAAFSLSNSGVNKFPSSRARVPWTTTPSFLPRMLLEKHGLLQLCISSFHLQYSMSLLVDLLCNYNTEKNEA